MQVNRLPRETLLCATLYALPIPPAGGSSEANKQRRVPEALGWVTTPLFNFRQYVAPGSSCLALEGKEGDRERVLAAVLANAPWKGWPCEAHQQGPEGPSPGGEDQGTARETRTIDVTKGYWAGLVAQHGWAGAWKCNVWVTCYLLLSLEGL